MYIYTYSRLLYGVLGKLSSSKIPSAKGAYNSLKYTIDTISYTFKCIHYFHINKYVFKCMYLYIHIYIIYSVLSDKIPTNKIPSAKGAINSSKYTMNTFMYTFKCIHYFHMNKYVFKYISILYTVFYLIRFHLARFNRAKG
jgi:hypothetical protein